MKDISTIKLSKGVGIVIIAAVVLLSLLTFLIVDRQRLTSFTDPYARGRVYPTVTIPTPTPGEINGKQGLEAALDELESANANATENLNKTLNRLDLNSPSL